MINLTKGGRLNLSKENPGLKRIRVGLGWDANRFDNGKAYDLDASAFVCKMDASNAPKLIADEFLVFYNNPNSPDGAVVHSGDNRTGDAAGDDETVVVDLTKIHADAREVSFIVTIHEAVERAQNFGQIGNSFIRLYDDETGAEIAKYALEEEFSTETAVQFGSIYKNESGQWLFKAVGQGFKKGLADFVRYYGGQA